VIPDRKENTAMTNDGGQELPMWVPHLGPEVHEATTRALAAGYLGLGTLSREFEEALSRYLELDGRQGSVKVAIRPIRPRPTSRASATWRR
jgi:hypothetical protein